MNIKQIKAVLYSVSQGCFHLETLEDYIKNNLENCLAGKSLDYKLIGVFETDKEADRFISRFDNWLKIVKKTDDVTSSLLN